MAYTFPDTYMNKCNRSCQQNWLSCSKYPWLMYSPKLDGRFCLPCVLFAKNRGGKGVLVNAPFTRWTKLSSVVGGHETLEYHRDYLTVAEEENPKQTIAGQFNNDKVERAIQIRVIMEHITRAILFLRKQCLALRGKGEDSKRGSNPGSRLSLLKPGYGQGKAQCTGLDAHS